MRRTVIFDDGLGQLGPMTDLRASFEVRTGMHTTASRLAAAFPRMLAAYWVPQRLAAVVAERANAPVNRLPDEETFLCINGRLSLPENLAELDIGEAMVESGTSHVVAAALRRADAEYFLTTGHLHERTRIKPVEARVLYKYPWDVMSSLPRVLMHDIHSIRLADAQIPKESATVVGDHPVEIHRHAKVYPNVVLDAERGPIMIHESATVRPGAVLCGPCSIGPGSVIIDRALIKPHTAIGPYCKVGGEVGATIFQGYSNKSHDGHLGDSWVGMWVNFGAGTTNSNLLNTYGEVLMKLSPESSRHRTGLSFLGAIVGDHTKLAINTRLMTGTVIGTGSMIATSAPSPTTVRRFAWLTDSGASVFKFEKFLDTAKRMMARRDVQPADAYIELLRLIHDEIGKSNKPNTALSGS